MTRFRFDTKEGICWKALNGEMSLRDAAEALTDDPGMQDPFSYIYPEAEVLEEMLWALRQHPQDAAAIELQYRERVLNAFTELLDIFTTPEVPYEPPKQYPIPRSAPEDRS